MTVTQPDAQMCLVSCLLRSNEARGEQEICHGEYQAAEPVHSEPRGTAQVQFPKGFQLDTVSQEAESEVPLCGVGGAGRTRFHLRGGTTHRQNLRSAIFGLLWAQPPCALPEGL